MNATLDDKPRDTCRTCGCKLMPHEQDCCDMCQVEEREFYEST